jgi:hypothetical protein
MALIRRISLRARRTADLAAVDLRVCAGDRAQVASTRCGIGCLDEDAAANALQVITVLPWFQRYFQQSHILPYVITLRASRFALGDDHLDKLLNDSFGCGFVQLLPKAMMPPKADVGSVLKARPQASSGSLPTATCTDWRV